MILMKKTRSAIALLLTVLTLVGVMSLSACGLLSPTPDVHYGEHIKVSSTRINELGELIITYSDGTEMNAGVVVAGGDTVINVQGDGGSVSAAATAGLSAAVSITANYKTAPTQSIIPGFGSSGGEEYAAQGSGVIYKLNKATGSAFIITNYHVVYDVDCNTKNKISDDIDVFLYGSETEDYAIPATFVGGSMNYDLAVLRVDNSDLLKRASVGEVKMADAAACVGETAIAVGNPEGEGISVSLGIVSVDSEYIVMYAPDGRTAVQPRVMRVDAAINSGNSGGGLYNSHGELIGIVNAKIVDESVENIGYAIPVQVVENVVNNIIDHCYKTSVETVMRPTLGITVTSSSSGAVIDKETGMLRIVETVVITEVNSSGIAKDALKVGDALLSIKLGEVETEITRQHHIVDLMLNARVGESVSITVLREGKEVVVPITLTQSAMKPY